MSNLSSLIQEWLDACNVEKEIQVKRDQFDVDLNKAIANTEMISAEVVKRAKSWYGAEKHGDKICIDWDQKYVVMINLSSNAVVLVPKFTVEWAK